MSANDDGKIYDITNEEQLRQINLRLDEMAHDRKLVAAQLKTTTTEWLGWQHEWQEWRERLEKRVDQNSELIADRLRHPLMDPQTVTDIRTVQGEIARHLTVQDTDLRDLKAQMNTRFAPFERMTDSLSHVTKLLRWVLVAFFGGGLYEVGKLVAESWFRR